MTLQEAKAIAAKTGYSVIREGHDMGRADPDRQEIEELAGRLLELLEGHGGQLWKENLAFGLEASEVPQAWDQLIHQLENLKFWRAS